MNIVNMMWSGGSRYISIHKVHCQVLACIGTDARISNWLLLGSGVCHALGPTQEWHLPPRALKGRHLWRLLRPWLRRRLRKALVEARAEVLLLDGVGVARLVLPLLRQVPELRANVLFHGGTRLSAADIRLLREQPSDRLNLAAVSQTLAQSLSHDLGKPVRTLRIALDPKAVAESSLNAAQARHTLKLLPPPNLVFGAVGRLVEGKGFEMLIEAFAKAASRQAHLHLAILGDGPLHATLQARIEALGLAERIHLRGHREDVQQLYRAFDWVLIPSRSEGLGLVVQEAVLAGVPVICSDLPVFREQLQDAGCYLPVGDACEWAVAIERCITLDPASMAARQRQVLAPEQAWQMFQESSASLLRG
ncbi:glycosyl transferase [Pseudomonas sp. SWI6]|uniref:Glycosyltransferase n=1 Tax=Pseudomonas taiwanensis TaxID=470150 RepID=A0ABR6V3H5_9PSED|nr:MULTISPECIES: glycosyltransferase [Pseudomonas]AGZ33312.1 glycosyl transferase [Pseudomonas sp. VLB120]AVD85101.1 glycosyl transferase [Pseudomonas sp. SWI6]AVD87333.1 glycosyl transferase [Pseudomonas sp. SWI44]MBC3474740.1 glycosyltransferase [Pseudomonas taiwanensis]MBC3491347.1 glycosyltransferase [Pseudomonas taiwanensis]